MNETERNRTLITRVMAALAEGDTRPYAEAMADDMVWRTVGTTAWSGAYQGRAEIRAMIGALHPQFDGRLRIAASRIVADGSTVVVEARGDAATKAGARYDNTYCMVFELKDGRMVAVTEYLDTALVERVLDPPGGTAQ